MALPLPVFALVLVLGACAVPPAADPSPSASPTASAVVLDSPSPRPTATPPLTPSPAATSSPATPPPSETSALLPPGSEARVIVDALHLRSEPGTSGPVVTALARDTIVYAAGPPFLRQADGLDWRWVIASGPPAEWQAGWVASGNGTSAYLEMVEVQCPEDDVDLETVIAMTEWARLSCFGGRDMVLEGTIITGFGGYMLGTFEPAWLASWGSGAVSAGDGHMFYHVYDQLPLSEPSGGIDGQRLRLTGHFDDPAAATCRISIGDPPIAEPEELAILYCRAKFVASSVELMDH